jgi:hypothetical protein
MNTSNVSRDYSAISVAVCGLEYNLGSIPGVNRELFSSP